jgi:hypothetical protein
MNAMKRFLLLLACSGAFAFAADLASARTVYVLSMSRGLDQYLANRLTNGHVLQVVTDPTLADVIFTDHIGDAFQAQLESISPTPVAEEEEAPPVKPDPKADAAKSDPSKADAKDAPPSGSMFGPTVNKLANPALASTFGRNKGTIFLVDAKTREVIWSVFDPPKSFGGKEMDRTASDIVSRLKKDLQKK